MTRVVVDASAFSALAFDEPAADAVAHRIEGAQVFAPHLLKYELANVAIKKARRHPDQATVVFARLRASLDARWRLNWQDVDALDAGLIAHATGLTAYDASYLWLAGALGADLVTLDERLASASAILPQT